MERDDDSWVGAGDWSEVASGLRMYMTYIITNVAFTVLVFIATFAVAARGSFSALDSVMTIAKVGAVVGVGIALYGLAAIWRYAGVAEASGARRMARASFYLGVATLAATLIGLVRLLSLNDLEDLAATSLWDVASKILGVMQFFCLLSSMRTLAGYIGRFDLHDLAGTTMLLAGVTVGLAVLSQIFAGTAVAPALLFGLGTLGIGIWCLVYLLMLVLRLARAVSRDAQLPGTFA
jgi:hypothetical protein